MNGGPGVNERPEFVTVRGSSLTLGIDPGKAGAVVGVYRVGSGEDVFAIDTADWLIRTGKGAKREYDEDAMARWLKALGAVELAVLEGQQAMPSRLRGRVQGTASSFSTGLGFGIWRGVLAGCGVPRIIVHPRTWTTAILKGAPGEGKARAISVVRRVLPDLDLGPRSKAEGRADAACLALYGLWQRERRADIGPVPGRS